MGKALCHRPPVLFVEDTFSIVLKKICNMQLEVTKGKASVRSVYKDIFETLVIST